MAEAAVEVAAVEAAAVRRAAAEAEAVKTAAAEAVRTAAAVVRTAVAEAGCFDGWPIRRPRRHCHWQLRPCWTCRARQAGRRR
ncbi:hypothetical protein SAMN05421539_102574 [Jannaschia seohaensis]|uniref:Uncharacterized protein n=1 Tax=Jannaschia seohaensis TaxID=475081 RepID=A0A2Y9C5Q6_9RHOB|nr:hypothetical protein BCF38_102574 [Jannaschia seohaensis]SSA41733.1 hypothetical protein SAMN05421539_102574 [Jannaschia seohaensis]